MLDDLIITKQHAAKALLCGACDAPRVGMKISSLSTSHLIWAEDRGIASNTELTLLTLPLWVLSKNGYGNGDGNGNGNGYGYGDGYGYGNGNGNGYGNGYGYGNGNGNGYGYGNGYGNGNGDGNGYGNGDGNGNGNDLLAKIESL